MTITRTSSMLLGLALAACSPAPTGNTAAPAENDAAADNILAEPADNAQGNDAAASKSILRPEVVEPEPAPPPLEPLAVVIPFASGMTLDDPARAALDRMMAEPAFAAGGTITLRGHSDSRGHDGDNLVASRKRAEAVRAYLLGKGVAADRVALIALGEARPIAPNANLDGSDDPEGRARNRRVEIEVVLPAAPVPAPTPTGATPTSQPAVPSGAPSPRA